MLNILSPKLPTGHDTFVIVPNDEIKPHTHSLGKLNIRPRVHARELVVSPCNYEHWISTDLFKFRLYAERQELHVIGICSFNQIPLFSLFCDEVILIEAKPTWYINDGVTINGARHRMKYQNIEDSPLRREFARIISDEEVVERFAYRTVYFLQSAYDVFLGVQKELPSDRIVVEYKEVKNGKPKIVSDLLLGEDRQFQKDLIAQIGHDNYMTVQIMASAYLNWQFLCLGGSSNLMCVLPVKSLCFRDRTINYSVEKIVSGFMMARCNIKNIPSCHGEKDSARILEDFALLTKFWPVPTLQM